MKYTVREKAVLLLEDGSHWEGYACGAQGVIGGEICFNTSMTGYQEIFTDPSYYGQLLIMNTSHIGNYGVNLEDVESDRVMLSGLVCNQMSTQYFSRPQGHQTLHEYLKQHQIIAISDIDTRQLVRHIRSRGAMNAVISSTEFSMEALQKTLKSIPDMSGLDLASKVSSTQIYYYGDAQSKYKVAVLDLGIKKNILRCLAEREAYCKVFPMHSSPEEILAWKPDGIMLSNGPGDPEALTSVIQNVAHLIDQSNIPMFGICLGHQIIALSQGIKTKKMHHGHRGVNHPIQNEITHRGEITSQNHGFVVDSESMGEKAEVTHRHLNDGSIAGIQLKNKEVFSVQYHPESSAGPNDSRYLFDQFIERIKKHKK